VLMYAARGGHVNIINKILESGDVAVDERNKESATALYIASREGALECVCALIRGGADVNIRTRTKRTPLHW